MASVGGSARASGGQTASTAARVPRFFTLRWPRQGTPEGLTAEALCVKLKGGDGARKTLRWRPTHRPQPLFWPTAAREPSMVKELFALRDHDPRAILPLPRRLGKLRRRRQQPYQGALDERRCRANTATAVTGPDHNGVPTVTQLDYDPAGRLTASVDPLGRRTLKLRVAEFPRIRGVGECGLLVAAARILGNSATFGSNAQLQSRRTAFGYDAAGQMTSLTRPDPAGDGSQAGPISGWTFDPLGRVVSQTDPLGNVTSLAYEDFGRRIVTTHPDPDGTGPLDSPVTVEQYDAAGNLIAETDPLGGVTAYVYDPLGRLVRVTHPDPDNPSQPGAETEYQYDKAGNLRFVIDVLGNVTELVYDHRDRLVEMILPDPDGLGSPQWTYTYLCPCQLGTGEIFRES